MNIATIYPSWASLYLSPAGSVSYFIQIPNMHTSNNRLLRVAALLSTIILLPTSSGPAACLEARGTGPRVSSPARSFEDPDVRSALRFLNKQGFLQAETEAGTLLVVLNRFGKATDVKVTDTLAWRKLPIGNLKKVRFSNLLPTQKEKRLRFTCCDLSPGTVSRKLNAQPPTSGEGCFTACEVGK